MHIMLSSAPSLFTRCFSCSLINLRFLSVFKSSKEHVQTPRMILRYVLCQPEAKTVQPALCFSSPSFSCPALLLSAIITQSTVQHQYLFTSLSPAHFSKSFNLHTHIGIQCAPKQNTKYILVPACVTRCPLIYDANVSFRYLLTLCEVP